MKLSIITIAFNSEKTIEETILSVLRQKNDNVEYIIVDGASTDGTLGIINKYKDKIDIIISEKDFGISDAFNKGIKLATGDVIGIINSDDFLAEHAIEYLFKAFEDNPNADIYFGKAVVFADKNFSNFVYEPPHNAYGLELSMVLSHPATFVKKNAYAQFGLFDTEFKCAMDFKLISHMYLSGAIFVYIDEILTWFRQGGVSKRQQKTTMEESIKIACNNGVAKKVAKRYYRKINRKEYFKKILYFLKIDGVLRRLIKKQQILPQGRYWFI